MKIDFKVKGCSQVYSVDIDDTMPDRHWVDVTWTDDSGDQSTPYTVGIIRVFLLDGTWVKV
jgi:hypothetical protein